MKEGKFQNLVNDLRLGRLSRREFIKRAAALGLSVPMAALLNACAPAPTPTPAPGVTPSPTAVPTPTPVPPTPTPVPKVVDALVFSHYAEVVRHIEPFFEEEMGFEMNIEEVVAADHRDKIISTHRTGSSDWDILPFWATVMSEMAHNGWLMDLTDLITEEFGPYIGDIVGGWKAFGAAKYMDRLYAIPTGVGGPALMWNKAFLEEAGLDPEKPSTWYKTPWSINEWVEYMKACTFEKEGVQHYGFLENWGDQFNYVYTAYIQMFGGEILDLTQNPPWGEPVLNEEPGVEALQFMVDLLHKHKCVDPASLAANWCMDIMPPFFDGRIAFISSWLFIYTVANMPEESKIVGQVGAAPNPAAVTTATSDGTEFQAVSAYAPNGLENAWEWLRYCDSYRMQYEAATKFKWGTFYESLRNHPDILKARPEYAANTEAWKYPHEMWFTPDYNAWVDIMRAEGHKALRLEKTPKEALDAAAEGIRALRATY